MGRGGWEGGVAARALSHELAVFLRAAGGSERRSVLGRGQLLRRDLGLRVTVGGL